MLANEIILPADILGKLHKPRAKRFAGKKSASKRFRLSIMADASPLPETIQVCVPGPPQTKPRQTQRDRWAKRPCVVQYRQWADRARASVEAGCVLPPAHRVKKLSVFAYFLIPASRTDVKEGDDYRQAPDADNLAKATMDSLWPDGDQALGDLYVRREWCRSDPKVIVNITTTGPHLCPVTRRSGSGR